MTASAQAFTARTSTILSARRKPGAEDRIVGQVLTKTAKGDRRVGFTATTDDGAALLDLVGSTVDVESRYCGPNVMIIAGVLPAAGEPVESRSVSPEHVTQDADETEIDTTFAGCTISLDAAGTYRVQHASTGYAEGGIETLADAKAAAKDISRAVAGRFRA